MKVCIIFFVNITICTYTFQYSDSVYVMDYLTNGTWSDAEKKCIDLGMHLWSINSYSEWWNVYNSLAIGAVDVTTHRDVNVGLIKITSSVLLFIGLQTVNEVCRYSGIFLKKNEI